MGRPRGRLGLSLAPGLNVPEREGRGIELHYGCNGASEEAALAVVKNKTDMIASSAAEKKSRTQAQKRNTTSLVAMSCWAYRPQRATQATSTKASTMTMDQALAQHKVSAPALQTANINRLKPIGVHRLSSLNQSLNR